MYVDELCEDEARAGLGSGYGLFQAELGFRRVCLLTFLVRVCVWNCYVFDLMFDSRFSNAD